MASDPFEHLFDISPFPAVISRMRDYTVVAINRRTSELFGLSHEQALGLKTTDYYADLSHRERLRGPLEQQGRADDVLLHLKRPNGETFWARASARLITWEGEPAVLTVFEDIDEELLAQRALQESERRLAAQSAALTELTAAHVDASETFQSRLHRILEMAADTLQVERVSMWRFDPTRSAIHCVDLFSRSSRRHQPGAPLARETAPAYFEAIERERVIAAHDARTDPRTSGFLHSYLAPNDIRSMLDVPLRGEVEATGVLCIEHVGSARTWTVDEQNFAVSTANLIAVAIADERRREALVQVAESDARAHMILDTAHDAFIAMDADSRIVAWNAQAERTFGWSAAEAIGRNLADTIIPAAFREAHNRGMARFLATGEAPVVNRRLELRGLHRDGHEFPIEITITSPMRRDAGYFFGAFLRNISDRIERDQMLQSAKDTAEAATRAKSEFLANMSHELRTPLNGVLGYAQLLQRDRGLTTPQRESLDAIMKCGAHLLDLINDVLDLSKIEAGRIDIEQTATDLMQLTTDLHHVVAESARRKGLFLILAIGPDVPRRVAVDGRHLRQVLLNLLGNAVKFTSKGEVRLDVAIDDQGRLAFAVTDTGIGVEPEELDKIFEAFTQTKTGSAVGGTGLGLTISRHLLNAMGADLNVESTPGAGSRFYFSLPLMALEEDPGADAVPTAPPALSARLAPGQQVTALVVDDSTVSRRILASLLDSAGFHVITAAGGFEGIELARTNKPDVIFIDVKMPDIDGFSATRQLRADPATAAIPVIAVTASAFGNTRQAAADAGCVAYLPKPIAVEALFAALQLHLGLRFEWGADDEPAAADDSRLDPRHTAVAARLRDAAAIGAVSDLHAIANELAAGSEADAALGRRIARLVAGFDFAGVAELADAIAASRGSAPVE
jgi:PAS domain S-box-containing protein